MIARTKMIEVDAQVLLLWLHKLMWHCEDTHPDLAERYRELIRGVVSGDVVRVERDVA